MIAQSIRLSLRRPHAASRVALVLLAASASLAHAAAQGALSGAAVAEAKAADGAVKFDLETIFPEKGLFGPSASDMAFSHDGTLAAWLYRPYPERRHGGDLWVHDFSTGVTTRVTSVSVMAPYLAGAQEVADDRIAKAKQARKEAQKGAQQGAQRGDAEGQARAESGAESEAHGGTWQALVEQARAARETDAKGATETGDAEVNDADKVSDEDAKDDKAPRYSGVSDFTWSPVGSDLLFTVEGDIFRWTSGAPGLERLTRTRSAERSVQYLPDGLGYTYLSNDALVRARFGAHFVDQLDPKLPDGQSMRSYVLSPDGAKVVFVSSNGSRGVMGNGRTVNIATYRDRFMRVMEVPRTVSDDPIGDVDTAIYLYRLPTDTKDNGELVKVYARERTGPRDVLPLPDWAPDSSKVAFAVFEQSTSQVHVLEASFPPTEPADAAPTEGADPSAPAKPDGAAGPAGAATLDAPTPQEADAGAKKPAKRGATEHPARIALRFLHDGGPNTPGMIQPRYLADSRRLVLLTEQTGFRHLHVLDPVYESLEALTRGRCEVYPLALSKDRESIDFAATMEDSTCLDVYRLTFADGAVRRLTGQVGQYENAAVSPDGKRMLATYSAYGSLRELVLVDTEQRSQTALTDSHPAATRALTSASPEFFTFENRHGQTIRGLMWKPADLKEGERRPLLVYVYGGPLGTRKQVNQGNFGSDAYFFAQYMVREHGYIACTIDPRGMSGYGAVFEKANFEQVGKPQVEDLVDGVRFMVAQHGADEARVGLHGWSFGGFQTQMCMYTEPKVFKCGIAGAGPTEWENYNSWYSTGTIGGSREGKTDLAKYSLLPLAKNLENKLLLVHGMEDSNVLYQDTVRVYSELLKAGKETLVELFLDPTGGHGLGGYVKSLNRFRKYEEFLVRCLGEGAPAKSGTAKSGTAE
ncbi:MAG: prolyl oligopeptidase family serine peptidase [Planctomycetota bacterium]